MRNKKSLAGTALVVAAGVALAGCAAGDAEEAPATETDTINLELWYAPATFNPALATATSDLQNARLGFDTLLRAGEDGLIGGLATDWEAALLVRVHFHPPRRRHLRGRHSDHAERGRRLVRISRRSRGGRRCPGRTRRFGSGEPDLHR